MKNNNNDNSGEIGRVTHEMTVKRLGIPDARTSSLEGYNFECGIIALPKKNKYKILYQLESQLGNNKIFKYDTCWLCNLFQIFNSQHNEDINVYYIDCGHAQYRHPLYVVNPKSQTLPIRRIKVQPHGIETINVCIYYNCLNKNKGGLGFRFGKYSSVAVDRYIISNVANISQTVNPIIDLDFENYDYLYAVSSIPNCTFEISFDCCHE